MPMAHVPVRGRLVASQPERIYTENHRSNFSETASQRVFGSNPATLVHEVLMDFRTHIYSALWPAKALGRVARWRNCRDLPSHYVLLTQPISAALTPTLQELISCADG